MASSRGKLATVASPTVPDQASSCSIVTGLRPLEFSQPKDCTLTPGRSLANMGSISTLQHIDVADRAYFSPLSKPSNPPDMQFACSICGRSFVSIRSKAAHEAYCLQRASQDPNDVFPCDLCDRDFKTKKGLSNHRTSCVKKFTALYGSIPSSQTVCTPKVKLIGTKENPDKEDSETREYDGFGSPYTPWRKTKGSYFNHEMQTWNNTTASEQITNADHISGAHAPHPIVNQSSPIVPPPSHHNNTSPPPSLHESIPPMRPHHETASPSYQPCEVATPPHCHHESTPPPRAIVHSYNPITLTQLVDHSRLESEWYDAQSIMDPLSLESPPNIVNNSRIGQPKTVDDWKVMDNLVSTVFDERVEVEKPTSIEEELVILKETIYDNFSTKYGTLDSTTRKSKKREKLNDEKKMMRKKKKAAKKQFKQLRREGAEDDEMRQKQIEWRNLTRLHNKIRLQELELERKLAEIKNNAAFSKEPFKFISEEITKGPPTRLEPTCDLKEAEEFFTNRYSDKKRCDKIKFPEFADPPSKPRHPLPPDVPTKDDFEKYIRSRRNKSSPGPDGIPFVVYKRCPQIRARLIQLLRSIWKHGCIPSHDKIAMKFLVAKTTSRDLKDFRDITLFNASLKALTGVWARKVVTFMTKNNYIDTDIQKGFVPRISGCIEHNQTLADMLKDCKKSKEEIHVAFLDLQNAFGSSRHNLILAAMAWYGIPKHMIQIIQSLYNNCFVTVKTSTWTTKPIMIQIGSLQGGPEAGVLFNIPWNMVIMGILKYMMAIGYEKPAKPISAFADDLTAKTASVEDMKNVLEVAQELCEWSECYHFKESKSATLSVIDGQITDPKIQLNGNIIPSITTKPFKFLGRWIYPSLKDKEYIESAVKKCLNLLKKTHAVPIDGRKKCFIYEYGILPYLRWDFMMMELTQTAVGQMESHVNKYLKSWLGLTRSADPSVLYRGTFGLNITNIKNAFLASRTNTEVILCTSKDPVVRSTAKKRRDSNYTEARQNTPKRIKLAVKEIEFKKQFCQFVRKGNDKRGFGADLASDKIRLDKKSIIETVKEMSEQDKIGKVLSLQVQSDWTNWDDLIQMDMKWNEMMYGYSPSLLSFWLNSIQNTLPDPINLRRWGKQKTADCTLCRWKNCNLRHIICSCRVALEQGRISWRHDSILTKIAKWIKESKVSNTPQQTSNATTAIQFVKMGQKPKKPKRVRYSYWENIDDWKILVDTRQSQYTIPSEIASSPLRPDICIYSLKGKKVCFIELTSPAEENIATWKAKKMTKYLNLVEEAKENGFTAICRTIEVGARGFISKTSMYIFSMLGFNYKKKETIRRELSKTAIRCSHFIWINRDNPSWSNPARLCN